MKVQLSFILLSITFGLEVAGSASPRKSVSFKLSDVEKQGSFENTALSKQRNLIGQKMIPVCSPGFCCTTFFSVEYFKMRFTAFEGDTYQKVSDNFYKKYEKLLQQNFGRDVEILVLNHSRVVDNESPIQKNDDISIIIEN